VTDQPRSARARRLDLLPPEPEPVAIVLPPELEPVVAPALEPELIAPDDVPVLPAVEPAVEPCAAAPPPPGVPVVPIGVFWVLRWPAPVAGLAELGFGGALWAKAMLTVAAAMAAARILEENIQGSLEFD
jgi:hypothetical protein